MAGITNDICLRMALPNLRVLSNSRVCLMKRHNALKNTIRAVMDEYFPELLTVFKYPLNGKASRQILKSCPFPYMILQLSVAGVLDQIKKAVQKTVGQKKAQKLIEVAKSSIGVTYATASAKLKLELMMEELELLTKQLKQLEDSSGQNKSRTTISKRGRKHLRHVLYQMARTTVAVNSEMKELYQYLKTRPANPLKKKQALVVISKLSRSFIAWWKKQTGYQADLVFNEFRKNQMRQAA